jgi:hypothetical protein
LIIPQVATDSDIILIFGYRQTGTHTVTNHNLYQFLNQL